MKCEGECEVWSVKSEVCGVCGVRGVCGGCGVESVSVKSEVWSVKCGV